MADERSAEGYAHLVRSLLDEVDHGLGESLSQAVDLVLDVVRGGGVIHAGGAGHSLAMVCETFYRAGGLACVRPLYHPELMPLTDALGSTRAERTPGLGDEVVAAAEPAPGDVLVVFSNSGKNHYPVEFASRARERGVPVIAVTSARTSAQTGNRLVDHATVVLDTGVPAGDTVFPLGAPRTSAVSTLNAAYVWGRLLAELQVRAEEAGIELPLWRSANMPGGDEANAALYEKYGQRIPALGAQVGVER